MSWIRSCLAEHPLFGTMEPAHLDLLAECGTEVSFAAGEIIAKEGTPASHFFLILAGEMVLEARDPVKGAHPIQRLGPGELVGWSWLFAPFLWHYQIRALTDCRTMTFDGAHMLVACEKDPKLGYQLMRRITQVVIQRLAASRERYLGLIH